MNFNALFNVFRVLFNALLICLVLLFVSNGFIMYTLVFILGLVEAYYMHPIYIWFKSKSNIIYSETKELLTKYEKSENMETFYTFFIGNKKDLSKKTIEFIHDNLPLFSPSEFNYMEDYKRYTIHAINEKLEML